jgi:hypothetical protein
MEMPLPKQWRFLWEANWRNPLMLPVQPPKTAVQRRRPPFGTNLLRRLAGFSILKV